MVAEFAGHQKLETTRRSRCRPPRTVSAVEDLQIDF
jgi:hypothetical protein